MNSSLLRVCRLRNAFCAGLLLACLSSWAQKPPNITPGEVALLPEYCPDTQTMSSTDPRGSAKAAQWVSKLGEGFWGLHHYCWALIRITRANQPGVSPQARRGQYEAAINDYLYVLANAPRDFILAPELYLRIGEAFIQLQSFGSALDAFKRAREAKPDYWPPYVRWAAVLQGIGKKREALAHLEEGLRLMPNERSLIEPYERYGGKYTAFIRSLPPAEKPGTASAGAASTPQPAAKVAPGRQPEAAGALPAASAPR